MSKRSSVKHKSIKKSPAKAAGKLTFIVVQGVDAGLKAKYFGAARKSEKTLFARRSGIRWRGRCGELLLCGEERQHVPARLV